MPGIASISLTVQRLKPESDPYRFRTCRATSTAFAPGKPVRNRIAINSGSVSAAAPRASSFSRGPLAPAASRESLMWERSGRRDPSLHPLLIGAQRPFQHWGQART